MTSDVVVERTCNDVRSYQQSTVENLLYNNLQKQRLLTCKAAHANTTDTKIACWASSIHKPAWKMRTGVLHVDWCTLDFHREECFAIYHVLRGTIRKHVRLRKTNASNPLLRFNWVILSTRDRLLERK